MQVPAHSGILGNKGAAKLVKKGTEKTMLVRIRGSMEKGKTTLACTFIPKQRCV